MANDLSRRQVLGLGVAGAVLASLPLIAPRAAWALDVGQARGLIDDVVGEINRVINSGGSEAAMLGQFEALFVRYADVPVIARVNRIENLERIYVAGADFAPTRANALGPDGWAPLLERCRADGEAVQTGLIAELDAAFKANPAPGIERLIEVRDEGVPVSFTGSLSTGTFVLTATNATGSGSAAAVMQRTPPWPAAVMPPRRPMATPRSARASPPASRACALPVSASLFAMPRWAAVIR